MSNNTPGVKPSETMTPFEKWWHEEGSGITPRPGDDLESHTRRVSAIAWDNGAFKANEGVTAYALLSRLYNAVGIRGSHGDEATVQERIELLDATIAAGRFLHPGGAS